VRLPPRWALAASAALVLGSLIPVLSPADSAQAFCESSIDPTCPGNLANAPILAEIGVTVLGGGSGVVGAATAITVASGGVVGLGAFNTAIGVVAAATAVTASGAVVSGFLAANGVQSGTVLHTSKTVSPGAGSSGPWVSGAYTPKIVFPQNGSGWIQIASKGVYQGEPVWCVANENGGTQLGYGWTAQYSSPPAPGSPGGDYLWNFHEDVCGAPPAGMFWSGGIWPSYGNSAYSSSSLVSITVGDTVFPLAGVTASQAGWHGTIRTTVTCASSTGSRPVVTSLAIDQPVGGDLAVPAVSCAVGELATSAVIEFLPTGQANWLPLTNGTVPGTVSSLVTKYPDCFGPGVSPCTMQLQRLDSGTSVFVSCGPLADYCLNWVAEAQASPSTYRCVYGAYPLDISYCSAFRRPGQLTPNTDGSTNSDGSAVVSPITAPIPTGSALGQVALDSTGSPATPDPSATPNVGTSGSQCFPSGWGVLNPVSWVFMPLQCALTWAFVPPKGALEAQSNKVRDALKGTAVGGILGIIGGLATFPLTGDGCKGITGDLPFPFGLVVHVNLLNACPGDPLAFVASVVKNSLTVALILATAFTSARYVGAIFGYVGFGGMVDHDRREAYRAESKASKGTRFK
jgi:hypothetical protein